MPERNLLLALCLLNFVSASCADVFRHVDGSGRVSYSGLLGPGGVLVVATSDARNIAQVITNPTRATSIRPEGHLRPPGASLSDLTTAFHASRDRLITAQQAFAADSQVPEMVNKGRNRNFARYLDKMAAREKELELASRSYQDALEQLNEQRVQQGEALISDDIGGSPLFDETMSSWRRIQAEVSSAR